MHRYHLDDWARITLASGYFDDTGRNGEPVLLGPSTGGMLVAWEQDPPADPGRIAFAALSSAGDLTLPEGVIEASPRSRDLAAEAAVLTELTSGEVLLTWHAEDEAGRRRDGVDETGYYGRLFLQDGTPQGEAFAFGAFDPKAHKHHDTAALTDGGVLRAWRREPGGDDDGDVMLRSFELDGTPRAPELRLGSGDGSQTAPALESLRDGGAALVYRDETETGQRIRLQLVNADGAPDGAPIAVDTLSDGAALGAPEVTVLTSGRIGVTWTDDRGDGGRALWGRLFEADGTPTGPTVQSERAIVPATAGMKSEHYISALANGGAVISWTDGTFFDGDVVLQRLGTQGGARGETRITETASAAQGRGFGLFESGELAFAYGEGTDGFSDDSDLNVRFYDYPRREGERLSGTTDDETLTGGDRNDTLDGAGGTDTLQGGSGADVLTGGGLLSGGGGRDLLRGADGADTLDGGFGRDTMEGGAGDDLYIVDERGDVVIEAPDGGRDTMVVRGRDYTVTVAEAVEVVEVEGDLMTIRAGAGAQRMVASGSGPVLRGGAGGDTLEATNSAFLYGGRGDDELKGARGNDFMFGGAGADILSGGGGRDRLIGSIGADTLTGGAGRDEFVLLAAEGGGPEAADTLRDLDPDEGDRLFVDDQILGFGRENFSERGRGQNASLRDSTAEEGRLVWDAESATLLADPDGSAGPAAARAIAVLEGLEGLDREALFDAIEFI